MSQHMGVISQDVGQSWPHGVSSCYYFYLDVWTTVFLDRNGVRVGEWYQRYDPRFLPLEGWQNSTQFDRPVEIGTGLPLNLPKEPTIERAMARLANERDDAILEARALRKLLAINQADQ